MNFIRKLWDYYSDDIYGGFWFIAFMAGFGWLLFGEKGGCDDRSSMNVPQSDDQSHEDDGIYDDVREWERATERHQSCMRAMLMMPYAEGETVEDHMRMQDAKCGPLPTFTPKIDPATQAKLN